MSKEPLTKNDLSSVKELFEQRFNSLEDKLNDVYLKKTDYLDKEDKSRIKRRNFVITVAGLTISFMGLFSFLFTAWFESNVKEIINNEISPNLEKEIASNVIMLLEKEYNIDID